MNSVVVKVIYRGKVAVAKLLRLDAQRKDLCSEVEVLKYINRYGLGPRLYSGGDWYLIEEYIDGEYLPAKLESLIDSGQHDDLKSLLRRILDKTYKLDVIGVDHGELSRADKHIIVSENYDPRIIDFESSSMSRRPRNLTSIIQYIFFRYRGGILSKTLGVEYDELILELSLYKTNYSENVFRSILTKLRIKDKLEKS
jgi:putative serine/threonine protein kinase